MENDVERSAYIGWRFRYWPHKEADQLIEKLLPIKIPRQENWLRFCRESLLLSTNEMASRLGTTASSYKRIERDLPLGKVTLQKLQQAASAMDCELVYFVRPKNLMNFSKIIWMILSPLAQKLWRFERCRYSYRARVLETLCRELMESPKFRRKQGWTLRKGFSGYDYYD